ncbi:MBL fold metallo-hydrolase [Curvibacter sp. HBC61]|uniref:MBL fold metallo-hydrolase n=1 Tax=Curvibacter cyanobacteriorum TaxID=3026422 RepID=A0ABT5N1H7_9BURK|nr:MBL fold metallo-hydrolase [Curvibacter sp. HBC61]MDD0839439.1 MBL fold metallo-hydrolase [Curvibacter sp. HBC61]
MSAPRPRPFLSRWPSLSTWARAARPPSWAVACGLALLGLAGCSSAPANERADAPHHTAQGFRNPSGVQVQKPFSALLRWQWDKWREGLPLAARQATPQQAPDLDFIHRNAQAGAQMQPALTWIGHASTLVQASGLNVLTDPMFSQRAFMVQWVGPQRQQAPGLALGQLPRIDVVLISHNHYDHLDRDSVQALAAQAGGSPLFLVPLGLKAWMQAQGIARVEELDWWQTQRVAGVDFALTPVQHWSARGLHDANHSLWGGWAVLGPDFHWYFSGDTGYSADFVATRQRFAERQSAAQGGGFDLALIAIGAYAPRWFMKEQHIDPDEAVQVHLDLGAKRSVGVHWGTFLLSDEALDQPPLDLAQARQARGLREADFGVMALGETRRLPRRAPSPP